MGTVPKHRTLTPSGPIKSCSCNQGEDQFEFWMAVWVIYYKVWHVMTMLLLSLISTSCAQKNELKVKMKNNVCFGWQIKH